MPRAGVPPVLRKVANTSWSVNALPGMGLKTKTTAQHGRSTEAEIREILERAVKPQQRLRMGSTLAELARRSRVQKEDLAVLKRDRTPAIPIRLE